MTSNIGSPQIAGVRAARPGGEDYESMKRQVTDQLRGHFRPEFLNRIDEVIVFHALTDADLVAIVDLLRRRPPEADRGQRPGAGADAGRPCADRARGHRPRVSGPGRSSGRSSGWSRTRSRGRCCPGTFQPGDVVTADADPVSGTLVFTTPTRDRRGRRGPDRRDAPAARVRGRRTPGAGRRSTCRRPTTSAEPDGDLVNYARPVRFERSSGRLEPLPDVLPDGRPGGP